MAKHNPRGLRRNPADGGIPDPNMGPLEGLRGAMGLTNPPINNQQDPLGIGIRQRSVASENLGLQSIPFGADPLNIQHQAAIQSLVQASADPQGFNTMNQAIKEQMPGGLRGGRHEGDPLPGLHNAPLTPPSTMWQGGQSSAVSGQEYGQDPRLQQIRNGLRRVS